MQSSHDAPHAAAAAQPNPFARITVVLIIGLIVASALISQSAKHALLGGFPAFLHVEKLGHVLGFACMGLALVRSRFELVRPWHVLAFAAALGTLTEVLQRLVPGRTAKLADVLLDVAGACAGVYLARRL